MNAATGWPVLVGVALRRDRLMLPAWLAAFVAMAALSASSVLALYPDGATRTAAALALDATPSLRAVYGPVYDVTSAGALAVWKPAGTGALLVAVLMIVLVVRHTRLDEEEGRTELLGSAVLGRVAPLVAALVVASGTALLLGAATAVALVVCGLPVAGSVAFGAAWAGGGLVFAAVAGVCAQPARTARSARGWALIALAAAFGLRAAGDAAGPVWLTWLSPLGWVQEVRAFAGERWWVLLVPFVAAGLLVAVAVVLCRGRDLGAGVVADRPGPAAAEPGLDGMLGLAWRLHRGVLAGWAAGFTLSGALLGSLAWNVDGMLSGAGMREVVLRLGGRQGLADAFLALDMAVLGMLAGAWAVQAVLRIRAEETSGRAEPVLATAVGRLRWAGAHLVVAAGGVVTLMLAAGIGAGLAAGVHSGDPVGEADRLVAAAMVHVPAAWLVGALAMALLGVAPRSAGLAWAVYGVFLVAAELGPFLRNPWLADLSPFTHAPHLPGPVPDAAPLLWLGGLTVVAAAVGLAGLRRRDMA